MIKYTVVFLVELANNQQRKVHDLSECNYPKIVISFTYSLKRLSLI